jgi:DNA-binding NtrC family response regulator
LVNIIINQKIATNEDYNQNQINFEDFHGFLSCDNITIKMIKRAVKCATNNSKIVWVEGEHYTGKDLLSDAIIKEYIIQKNIEPNYSIDFQVNKSTIPQVLIYNIKPSYSVEYLQNLYQTFKEILDNSTNKLLIINTYPSSYYSNSCASEIDLMRHDLIQNQYEYITLQPLRNRTKDVEFFYSHYIKIFLKNLNSSMLKNIEPVSQTEVKLIFSHQWQQNFKELQHLCFLIAQGLTNETNTKELLQQYLPAKSKQLPIDKNKNMAEYLHLVNNIAKIAEHDLNISLLGYDGNVKLFNNIEKEIILKICQYLNGSKTNAAKELGIGRTTLYRKLQECDKEIKD